MKKIALLLLLATCNILTTHNEFKKIVILTSSGGGGQVSVNNALSQTLKKKYSVKSELYFSNILNSVDPVSLMTFGNYTGEDVYNYFQKKRSFGFLQGTYELSRWYYYLFSPLLIKQTTDYLKKEKPDLVISIIPIVNDIIAKSCKKLDIPFLIIPPDLDIGFYIQDMRPPYSKNLYLALPFDNNLSRKSMTSAHIPQNNIFSFKYPLRHDFYEEKNIPKIKKENNITNNHPIILLMMGAQGNHGIYTFSKELTKFKDPAHLLICIGKNEDMRSKLEKIPFPQNITPHIIGYTERISDLMAISDVMISKTGGISLVEALYSNLPIIADQTEYVVSWELFHQNFLRKYGCGLVLRKLCDLSTMLTKLIGNPRFIEKIKNNIAKTTSNQPKNSILPIVKKIIR